MYALSSPSYEVKAITVAATGWSSAWSGVVNATCASPNSMASPIFPSRTALLSRSPSTTSSTQSSTTLRISSSSQSIST